MTVAEPWQKPVCSDPNVAFGPIPSARSDAGAALADGARELVLFGGDEAIVVCGDTPKRQHVGDTWVLDVGCGAWTELDVVGPSPRARHSMVADPARNRALVFGGRYRETGKTGNYVLYNDVWAFDHGSRSWSQLPTTGPAPSPRSNSAVFVEGDTLWVFGGTTSPSALAFAPTQDLHALDLQTNEWREVAAVGAVPPKRLFHAMAVDPDSRVAYVAYGGDANAFVGPFFKDLHALDLATLSWSAIPVTQPIDHDFGRIKPGLAFRRSKDGEAPRLMAFGGHDDVNGSDALGNRNDVLALELPSDGTLPNAPLVWEHAIVGDRFNAPSLGMCNFPADFVVPDPESIERRSGFAFAPVAGGEAFVVFGGDSDCGRLSDAWWYDARHDTWTPIAESLPGLTCPRMGNPASCKSLCG